MKKLMFAAALAATAAIWAEGLESHNTVGYQTMDLTAGKQVMKGAMFVTVGDTALSLQDIRMDSDTLTDATTKIWWWNKDTRKYTNAFWCPACNANGDYIDANGTVVEEEKDAALVWGDGETWVAIEKTFAPGEGFWIQPADDNVAPKVSIAGELATTDSTIQYLTANLTAGKQVQFTQPMPVGTFGLQTIKISGVLSDATTKIWWWNKDTRKYTNAFWCPACNANGDYIDANGTVVEEEKDAALVWGDGETWVAIDKTFDAGEAFWVQPADDSVSPVLMFPNPFYVAQ